MKQKISISLFILTTLFLLATADLTAQTNYDYAVIDFEPFNRELQITINGDTYDNIKVDREDLKGDADLRVALKEVIRMNAEGWELFQATTVAGSSSSTKAYTWFLRRKKT